MEKPSNKNWRKLTKNQKELFNLLNAKFNAQELYPPKSPTFICTKKEIECIAHNLALVAVWSIGEQESKKGETK